MSSIDSVLHESRVFPPSDKFRRSANVSGREAYDALCAEAAADYEGFWRRLGSELLTSLMLRFIAGFMTAS
jgi:acetyl-CoA synthetase